jgi:hypothetical protein
VVDVRDDRDVAELAGGGGHEGAPEAKGRGV